MGTRVRHFRNCFSFIGRWVMHVIFNARNQDSFAGTVIMIPPRILHGLGLILSGLVEIDRSRAECRYIACASRAAKLPVPRPAGRLVLLLEVGSHSDCMQPNRSVLMRMLHFVSPANSLEGGEITSACANLVLL